MALNVEVLAAAATVTEAGTFKAKLLLEREIRTPPAGAGLESVTVHVLAAPLPIVVGAHDKELTSGGAVTVIETVCELLL